MNLPEAVSAEEWEAAHETLLAKEKEATRAQDALAAERRRQPMVRVEKDYEFDGPEGKVRLVDLFEGRRQLIVYHFMFGPNQDGSRAATAVRSSPTRSTPRASACPRYLLRTRLASAACEARVLQGADGLAGPLVLLARERLQRRPRRLARAASARPLPGRRELRAQRLPPRRRSGLSDLLHRRTGHGDAGHRLDLPRPDPAWAPGDLGGLARGAPADTAVRVVATSRRVRGGARSDERARRISSTASPAGSTPGSPMRTRRWRSTPHLFGWEAEETTPPGSDRRLFMCRLRGRDVTSIGSPPPVPDHTPVWGTYVWVESAEETAAKAAEAGGSVAVQPFESLDGGRIAILVDPAGAVFGIWQPGEHRGAAARQRAGRLVDELAQHPRPRGVDGLLPRRLRMGARDDGR